MTEEFQTQSKRQWLSTIFVLLFLALILWVARYWHSSDFGLYEDDLTVIPEVMHMTGGEYFQLLIHDLSILHPHGSPLSNSFVYTFTFLGSGEGFQDLYLFGYLILIFNVFLFYGLLRRLFDMRFALIGGVAYVLFSADTTQAFLTHSFALQTSLTFLLLALHSYLSRKRILTYIFGILILFTYEVAYFLLLAAPLLDLRWDKKRLKEIIINGVILFLFVGAVYGLRSAIGGFRGLDLTYPSIITTPLLHMIQGPIVAMGTFFYRPVQALKGINLEIAIVIVLSFLVFYLVLRRVRLHKLENLAQLRQILQWQFVKTTLKEKGISLKISEELNRIFKLLILGGILLVLAYPLTFTIRAYAISGRDTRVHLAAVIGASILWASIGWLLLAIGETLGRRRIIVVLLSGFFALLVGYGFVIQKDYVDAWTYQKELWTELLPLIPDVEEGDVILLEPSGLENTRQIGANTWNLPRLLDQIYMFPSDWKHPPRVYRLVPGWQESILGGEGIFVLNGLTTIAPSTLYQEVPSADVIFIETCSGSLVRATNPLELDGQEYPLRQYSSKRSDFEKNILYDLIINE